MITLRCGAAESLRFAQDANGFAISLENERFRGGKAGLAEKVFGSGADDAGGGFRGGLVAVAADENSRGAFRFAHQETGGCGELVGDGENRSSKSLSLTVAGAPQVEENGHARRADGYISEPKTPGAAESIADDDGDALAGPLAQRGSESFCGTIGISRKQSYDMVAGNV